MHFQPALRRAFTLIELLIVVAIIAILAAIAVPNFLEAQTRSKVSRVKADMRSLATALEAYYVDDNRYPPDFSDTLPPANNVIYNDLIQRLRHLSTPIAYITTLPEDIFAEQVAAGGARRINGAVQDPAPYQLPNGEIIRPIVYDYAKFDRDDVGPKDSISVWAQITKNPENVAWALNSPGPDTAVHEYLGFPQLTIYDPTNGTVSFGQIIRTNLGAEDEPQR